METQLNSAPERNLEWSDVLGGRGDPEEVALRRDRMLLYRAAVLALKLECNWGTGAVDNLSPAVERS